MKYDLKDIITFVNVANLGSFTKTSQTLNISKTVVTTRINNLEDALGLTLLARTTREVNLTVDGKNFLNHCLSILKKLDDLEDFLDNCKGINGTMRIAIPPYFSRYHIVPYLGEFFKKYPNLKLDITLTENPINIIQESFDLQIRIQIPDEENLQVANLMSNRKVVCASPQYIKKYGEPKTPQDLVQHNCIIFGENASWNFQEKGKKKIIEMRDLKGNVECDNGEIIKQLVLSGLGITLKSACDIEEEIKNKKLVPLLTNYEVINETKFYAIYPSGRQVSPKIKAFIEFFQDKLLSKRI